MLPPTHPDLTISIVTADNSDLLVPCLRSIFANTHRVALEVFVIDNASGDGTAAAVAGEFPQVTLIRNTTRLGFSTNNNLVLKQGKGRYLMLLNDDTLVLDGALDTLVAFADGQPDAGIVGSFLLNPDQTFQAAFSALPNPWIEGFWSTAAVFPQLHAEAKTPFTTQTVCGAALMIRRETMEQVGILDTMFDPIYAEETDWCCRVLKAGWKIYSHPQAQIVHYGGQTMDKVPIRKLELLQGHKARYFRKHHGRWAEIYFRTTLCLASLAKVFRYSIPPRSPQKRERRQLHWHMVKHAFLL
ncbi:MAG: glycosyltransferase family 2 protein [Anaerolineae bacterium]|nr:glycosyltransferase family 2 protein [Anaerolineae bacterium]